MKLVIPLHSLYWSIHTKDESKCGTAFAFIFGVNWLWHCGVTASFGVFFYEINVTEWQVSWNSWLTESLGRSSHSLQQLRSGSVCRSRRHFQRRLLSPVALLWKWPFDLKNGLVTMSTRIKISSYKLTPVATQIPVRFLGHVDIFKGILWSSESLLISFYLTFDTDI